MHRNCCACLMTTMDSATQGSHKNTKHLNHREWYFFLFSPSCEMSRYLVCFPLKFGWNKLLWHITHSSSCACFLWLSPNAILLSLSLKPSFNHSVSSRKALLFVNTFLLQRHLFWTSVCREKRQCRIPRLRNPICFAVGSSVLWALASVVSSLDVAHLGVCCDDWEHPLLLCSEVCRGLNNRLYKHNGF